MIFFQCILTGFRVKQPSVFSVFRPDFNQTIRFDRICTGFVPDFIGSKSGRDFGANKKDPVEVLAVLKWNRTATRADIRPAGCFI